MKKYESGQVSKVHTGPRYNLVELKTTTETLQISDWNKFPIKENEEYTLELQENGEFLNLISIEDSKGNKLEINKKDKIIKLANEIISEAKGVI